MSCCSAPVSLLSAGDKLQRTFPDTGTRLALPLGHVLVVVIGSAKVWYIAIRTRFRSVLNKVSGTAARPQASDSYTVESMSSVSSTEVNKGKSVYPEQLL